jgi:hypothetical protein
MAQHMPRTCFKNCVPKHWLEIRRALRQLSRQLLQRLKKPSRQPVAHIGLPK